MIESVAWALGATGVSFSVAFGTVGVVKTLYGDRRCDAHTDVNKGIQEFKSLINAILVAFSDIASIKQALIWMAVERNDDTQEGKELRDKVVRAMMKPFREEKPL